MPAPANWPIAEASIDAIPDSTELLLCNPTKPDGRLRTTKALQKRVKAGQAKEQLQTAGGVGRRRSAAAGGAHRLTSSL